MQMKYMCKNGQMSEDCNFFCISDVNTKVAIIVIVVVLVLVLVGFVVGWVYYAYTHPTSASGMWLMEVS